MDFESSVSIVTPSVSVPPAGCDDRPEIDRVRATNAELMADVADLKAELARAKAAAGMTPGQISGLEFIHAEMYGAIRQNNPYRFGVAYAELGRFLLECTPKPGKASA